MKMTKLFPRTRYGEVGNTPTMAHSLLLKGGFIKQVAPGIYIILPLGFRVWRNIRNIVWDAMEEHGIQNLQLPILQPKELWEESGRWDKYVLSKTIFETTERHTGSIFGLAPTAEEIITRLARETIQSWRDLPVIWHQIGWKFRDEIRPRHGLLRGREFDMSDAYSFDADEQGMRKSFQLFREIYTEIFARVGLPNCISVQADSGAIGGQGSAEFMAISEEGGEDTLITCDYCAYGANAEKADSIIPAPAAPADLSKAMRVEHTPDVKTVEGLCRLFPELNATRMIKTIIFTVNAELGPQESYEVAVCIRGDLEINQIKLANALNALSVAPAEAHVVREVTGAEVGFAGPINLKKVRRILFDQSTKELTHILCGLNRTDYHALDVVPGKDFKLPEKYYNLHLAVSGHGCIECGKGELKESRGIEVGHVFMLQTGYAEKMGATYLGEDGQPHVIWMGCYGIGTTRLIQAVASQNFDADGIIWPEAVAPFQITIVPTRYDYEDQKKLADELYERLKQKGLSVLLDDRDERAGVKFKDADLIGCPWRINVGRKAGQGIVELLNRRTKEMVEVTIEEAVAKLT